MCGVQDLAVSAPVLLSRAIYTPVWENAPLIPFEPHSVILMIFFGTV